MIAVAIPPLDEKGESFANLAQELELWNRGTNLDASERASALVLQMDPVASDVCLAVGGDQ